MFKDHLDGEVLHRATEQGDGRGSRMPLYLTGFLIAVAVVEQVGQHLLT